MMYRVVKAFSDSEDDRYVYWAGDEYPRKGYEPTAERIEGLLGTNNMQRVPLIAEEREEKPEVKKRKKK